MFQTRSHFGGIPSPLNQGRFGTCVPSAFAQVLSSNLYAKYGICLKRDLLAEKANTLLRRLAS